MRSALLMGALSLLGAGAESSVRGMRHPALSPDGRRLAFSYHGDLWVCPSGGGRAERLTTDPADEQKPAWSPDGKQIAYSTDKAGSRDLHIVDVETRESRPLTFHSADDDAPAWSPDGRWIAFQSNRDSNLDLALNNAVWDLWVMPSGGGTATRLTRFRGENPAWSPDGKWIAYDRYASGYGDGEHNIFVISSDGSGVPREIAAGGEDSRRPLFRGDSIYFAHEANGILSSGSRNVWRARIQGGALRQVTGHRGDHVTWPTAVENSPSLVYEYDFDFYAIDLRDTAPQPKRLEVSIAEIYPDAGEIRTFIAGFSAPAWSPSGRQVAFACRGEIWIASPLGGEAARFTRTVEEEREPAWSADGKLIVYAANPWGGTGHIYLAPAEGGEPRRITGEAAAYARPRLSPDGRSVVVAKSDGAETDLWIFDVRSGTGRALAAEKETEESWGSFSPDGTEVAWLATKSGQTKVMVRPAAGGNARVLKEDKARKSGLAWSPDGRRLAYVVSTGNSSGSLRLLDVKRLTETTVASGPRAPSWSPDGSMVVAESRREGLAVYDADGTENRPVALTVKQAVTRREEMKGLFLQVWSTYRHHYYDVFFHGIDMDALRTKYEAPASDAQTWAEVHDLINDMIRELRSSHIQLKPAPAKCAVETGSLGADLERRPEGSLVLRRIERGGPADKAGLREGEAIVSVNGEELRPGADFDRLMTGATIPEVRLGVRDGAGEIREAALRGLSRTALRELKYANSVARRKEITKERSGGRLGYHHIRMMQQAEVTRLKGAIEKEFPEAEGLVFDERDGVGGMAHRPVCSLLDSTAADRLDRHPACYRRNRNGWMEPDTFAAGSSGERQKGKSWDRPVIMIQNEISRSDKEILPYTFRHLGIGYLVGMPTAGGVIGGNDWTMQDGSKITVSVQGWFTAEGRNLEGWGVPPDFRVPETQEDLAAGRDAQLEKAIEVLLAQIDGKIASPRKVGQAPPPAEGKGK